VRAPSALASGDELGGVEQAGADQPADERPPVGFQRAADCGGEGRRGGELPAPAGSDRPFDLGLGDVDPGALDGREG
jgi:hypothetical protein